jgi:non-ribosomal peptide synthetase component F
LPPPAPYRNHVAQSLAYARTGDAETFFRSRLADVVEPTAPFGIFEVQEPDHQAGEALLELDEAMTGRIRAQARRLGVTVAALFHAAWGLVVAHTSDRDDVVFGSVLLGRMQGSAGAQHTLGMFINTLPLRLSLRGLSAQALVERTQQALLELLEHEQASLADAQRCSGVPRSAPLFTTLLNFLHSGAGAAARWPASTGIEWVAGHGRTMYPITMTADDQDARITLTAETDARIDPQQVVGYMATAVRSLVAALETAPQQTALMLPILA